MYGNNTSVSFISDEDKNMIQAMISLPTNYKVLAMGFILGMTAITKTTSAQIPAERPGA